MKQGDIYESRNTGKQYKYVTEFESIHILFAVSGKGCATAIEKDLHLNFFKVEQWFEVGRKYAVRSKTTGRDYNFEPKWLGEVNRKDTCFGIISYDDGSEDGQVFCRRYFMTTHEIVREL